MLKKEEQPKKTIKDMFRIYVRLSFPKMMKNTTHDGGEGSEQCPLMKLFLNANP
jgi:hypothetical protein